MQAQNPKSVTSFMRKKLKIKGNSYHEGRGFITMEHNSRAGVLVPALEEIAEKYNFITLEREGDVIMYLVFADLYTPEEVNDGTYTKDNYYRTVGYNKNTNELVVLM